MQKVSRYIYLLLKNSVTFAATSLLLAWLSTNDSSIQAWFNEMALYGTMLSVFLFFVSLIVLILFAVARGKKFIYLLLKNAFMFTAVSLLLSWLNVDDSPLQGWFSGLALYGTMISVYLFFLHVIAVILSALLKDNSKG